MLQITCPSCHRTGTVPDAYAGRTVKCPGCQTKIVVVAPTRDAPLLPVPARRLTIPQPLPEAQAPQVMQCPFCAEELPAGSWRCFNCGQTLDVARRAAEEAERRASSPQIVVQQHVNVYGHQGFPFHALYAILTLISCGLWGPIWLIHYLCWSAGRARYQ